MRENLHTSTRIPVNDDYAALVGKAVYVFAYYEWTIIYIIDSFVNGFVSEYSRPTKRPFTSGDVYLKFKEIIDQTSFPWSNVSKSEIDECQMHFKELIDKRNALIHAHPATVKDGIQILAYQTQPSKPITDMIWTNSSIEELIQEIDKMGVKAVNILEKLRNKSN